MVNGTEINPLKELIDFPPEMIANIGILITILKTLGIVFIIYLIFLIIKGYFDIRRILFLKRINQNLNEINEKLNKLLEFKNKRKK
ncbi:hypothetical protein J4221_04970 [Candidatus Pacearchaeota archaeon]|nr:hypothetical protein [Candidatus Pacearchaeota archaeon]